MNTSSRKPYVSSARLGAKLSTSAAAIDARLNAALAKVPALRSASVNYGKGARDPEVVGFLDNGVLILVSYETVVAFRLRGETSVRCVKLGTHSRTTDRSVVRFAGGAELLELTPDVFNAALTIACRDTL
jgi:hypothetical protein